MEEEVVRRRAWLSRDEFVDLLGATNLIPGPNSTEMAIHIGHRRAGWPGLVVAGACFILPAVVIVGAISWAYVRYGSLPAVAAVLYGVKPVMVAVVLQALWALGRTAIKTRWLGALAAASFVAAFLHQHELLVLLGAGALSALVAGAIRRSPGAAAPGFVAAPPAALAASPVVLGATGAAASATSLFLIFAKIGSVLYGSGYVLLAFLRADLVHRLGWLSEAQLLDAVAVGQITPGPVFTTATFIGYVIHGWSGAAAATAGIFAPAFVFVALSGPLVPRIRRSKLAGAFLDGVNVASLALMAAVTWDLGRAALIDVPTIITSLVAAALLLWRKVNSVWLILLGAVVGVVVRHGLG
jgi:chromate transporter